jgi:hypothetical protein
MIAYVSPGGALSGTCTATAPCRNIDFALALTPTRPFILADSGTYSQIATLRLTGSRRIIGRGLTPPIIRRSTMGPIVTLDDGVFGLEYVDIVGATGDGLEADTGGHGVLCPANTGASVRIIDSVVRENASNGVRGRMCTVELRRSRLSGNGLSGLAVTDSTATVDSCVVSGNEQGLNLDAGVFSVTNNFIFRNAKFGIQLFLFSAQTGSFEFNTIVDNGVSALNDAGFACSGNGASMPNNIIARNSRQTSGNCTFPSSIILDGASPSLMFVSPDVAPFDYHIKPGSMAIDMATITTIDHDFDGDPRPSDAADVGADEL